MKIVDCDYFVVGSGMAGLMTALHLADKGKVVLVVGSEGNGICSPVRAKCDFLAKLPLRGKVNSLNAGVAAAIALYEILRQHPET